MITRFTLLLCLFVTTLFAQNDCSDAIIVCGNVGYSGLSATGQGVQELNGSNTCGGVENNTIWLQLKIKTGGTLGFVLTPNSSNIEIDFDFFIFGPDATCGDIGQAIRCSTTNPEASGASNNTTGMRDTETDTAEGPGEDGNNFVQWLTVEDNETYFLVIDRPIGSSNFSLEWTGTALFFDQPVFNNPDGIALDMRQCDDDGVDDSKTDFDLTLNEAMLFGDQDTDDFTLTYHEGLNGAITGENPIGTPEFFRNTITPQTVYMRITNIATGCFETLSFEIEVPNDIVAGEPLDLYECDSDGLGQQEFNLAQNETLLRNGNPDTAVLYFRTQQNAIDNVDPIPVTFTNEARTQTIWARVYSTAICLGHDYASFTINVLPAPNMEYTLDVDDFRGDDNAVRIVMDDASVPFEYSFDGSPYGDDPRFSGLEPGPHRFSIRSADGCKTVFGDVVLLDYPRFFTPNGDGKNDTWRLPYLNFYPEAVVTVYDRFGRVITGFKGGSPGWDGTLDGTPLPATDYWFVLQLDNGRIIKGHFALVR